MMPAKPNTAPLRQPRPEKNLNHGLTLMRTDKKERKPKLAAGANAFLPGVMDYPPASIVNRQSSIA
jgi:hypothetical protein